MQNHLIQFYIRKAITNLENAGSNLDSTQSSHGGIDWATFGQASDDVSAAMHILRNIQEILKTLHNIEE